MPRAFIGRKQVHTPPKGTKRGWHATGLWARADWRRGRPLCRFLQNPLHDGGTDADRSADLEHAHALGAEFAYVCFDGRLSTNPLAFDWRIALRLYS
jgi:hypothetical protein